MDLWNNSGLLPTAAKASGPLPAPSSGALPSLASAWQALHQGVSREAAPNMQSGVHAKAQGRSVQITTFQARRPSTPCSKEVKGTSTACARMRIGAYKHGICVPFMSF